MRKNRFGEEQIIASLAEHSQRLASRDRLAFVGQHFSGIKCAFQWCFPPDFPSSDDTLIIPH